MSKLQFLIGILLFQFSLLYGQTKEITGKVIDAKDQSPLGGVTITLKGSKGVAQTGTDGTFTIKVSAKATALHLTYIGYENKDVEIDALTGSAVITLQQSSKALNEVVVVGYGKALKKDLTGSISKLASKEIENFPAPSFESAIQGKAPGVVVTSGSGKLGQAIQVSIRGISSISASSQPLYVVDGLPITSTSVSDGTNDDTNPLADINPNDIESVEVLKDASAAAIYGARASNGVVLITTKKGRNGQKTTIELNVSHGVSNPARKLHFLNAKQYVGLMQQSAVNDGTYDFNNQISGYNTVDDAINDYFTSIYQPILDQYSL
ncbi:MAG: TonB-dependent receptor plug domain-containing protein, partial [Bacteroidetes bacterium]|nr:TonB-dependent receptor plug domain-containing protein [Bacteroidota bacterium]